MKNKNYQRSMDFDASEIFKLTRISRNTIKYSIWQNS